MSSNKEFESEVFFSDQVSEKFDFALDHACLADKLVDQLETMYVSVMTKVDQWEKDGVVNAMATVKWQGWREHTNFIFNLTGTKPWDANKITEYKKNMLAAKKKMEEVIVGDETNRGNETNAELEELRTLINEYPDSATEYLLQRITGNLKIK